MPSIPAADHLGQRFPSKSAMARAWGLTLAQLNHRLSYGWDLERALTTPLAPGRTASTHQRHEQEEGPER